MRTMSILLCVVFCSIYNAHSQHISIRKDTILIEKEYFEVLNEIMLPDSLGFSPEKYIEIYYTNGILKTRTFYDADGFPTGMFQSFYPNGQTDERYFQVKGRSVGAYLKFFPNGSINILGKYKDILCYDDVKSRVDTDTTLEEDNSYSVWTVTRINSIRVGKWITYNEIGDVIKKEDYGEEGKYEDW